MDKAEIVKRELAIKYNITVDQVDEVIQSGFKYLKQEMERVYDFTVADFTNFHFKGLGKFFVSEAKRYRLRKCKVKKEKPTT